VVIVFEYVIFVNLKEPANQCKALQ